MAAKRLLFKAAAREKVLRGATALADNYGFDASRCEYVDLVEAGIIDPTNVARIALENAVSVASVLLLAEGTLTEIPEEKKKVAAAQESFE